MVIMTYYEAIFKIKWNGRFLSAILSVGAELLLKNSYGHYLLQSISRAKVEKTKPILPTGAAEAPGVTGPQEAVPVDP